MTDPHPCYRCGKPATRWSGCDVWRGMPLRNTGVHFCCTECDPQHKWFDYSGEPLQQDENGLWHEAKSST